MIHISDFKAVIFDMDGVLIDSEPLWKIAIEQIFREVGCDLTASDIHKTAGMRIDEVVLYWHEHVGWENVTPKETENRIMFRMLELIKEYGKPLSGVLETLKFLKSKDVKIGLGTSSYANLKDAILKQLNIESFFDFTHSAEYEPYGKPHPAVYLTVAEKLQVQANQCLVIEDSLNGIISAKAAKMKVLCIPDKSHFPDHRLVLADYRLDSMEEFLQHLRVGFYSING